MSQQDDLFSYKPKTEVKAMPNDDQNHGRTEEDANRLAMWFRVNDFDSIRINDDVCDDNDQPINPHLTMYFRRRWR